MRSQFRFWAAVSLLLVAGALLMRMKSHRDLAASLTAAAGPSGMAPRLSPLLTTPSVLAAHLGKALTDTPQRGRYQVSNVGQSIELLTKVETAVLMRNALIDTREPIDLGIPEKLRAGENPGAYIVQAIGPSTAAFQDMLRASGAEIVAYIPNNAFLVKAGRAVASALESRTGVQAVLPYEPYYKVDTRLLKFALDEETMAEDAWLRVTLFPGEKAEVLAALSEQVGSTEKFVFGEQVLIQPRAGALADLAQLPNVQLIEPWNPRVQANDLTRVALGISVDSTTNENRYQLTGSNQWVNVNDIGVDPNHPDLLGHVFYHLDNAKLDLDGHGTHVAATIAGAGVVADPFDQLASLPANSTRVQQIIVEDENGNTTTNILIDGSVTNASFRGMAPMANLFVLPVAFGPGVNKAPTDSYLIETAAATNYITLGRDKTLISNNSWNYANTLDYDSQAARFDWAARDALQTRTGSQPVLYVFAAGNYGGGEDTGSGGEPGRIASPGTAKNVLTIGALETPRLLMEGLTNIVSNLETNDESGEVFTNLFTNVTAIFLPLTDSSGQVANFSSRGNVGIGTEGAYGRFKPDLVAPGTFIFSARSEKWNLTNNMSTNTPGESNVFKVLTGLNKVSTQYKYDSGTSFAAPSVSGLLALLQEFFTLTLDPDKRRNMSPALMKAYLINSARSFGAYDLQVQNTINFQGWGGLHLERLIPADTNGVPLMEKLEESKWPIQLVDQSTANAIATGEMRTWNIEIDTNSAALPFRFTLVWTDPPGNPAAGIKLVNDLDLVVEAGGFIYHGNDILGGRTFTEPREDGLFDDDNRDVVNNVENVFIGALPRGTTNVTVHVIARRVNVKAVNDYYEVKLTNTTDSAHTYRATNEIVQDFALVVSSEHTRLEDGPFKKFELVDPAREFNAKHLQIERGSLLLNGLEITNQRVGANPQFYLQDGASNQWNFYVFTNKNTPGQLMDVGTENVVFILSTPMNLGLPRNVEPDIDLYVSTDQRLTNLVPSVVASAYRSTSRGGTEQLVFKKDRQIPRYDSTGAQLPPSTDEKDLAPVYPDEGGVVVDPDMQDKVFYIGVKSEDQQAAEYSFIVISTDQPLEEDRNGVRILRFFPMAPIPDGLPNQPGGRRAYAVPLRSGRILDASTYLALAHQELGDLIGNLRHNYERAVLNNHSLNDGDITDTNAFNFIYSDFPYGGRVVPPAPDLLEYPPTLYPYVTAAQPYRYKYSDGPGLLAGFAGAKMLGQWILEMVDNAASHIGELKQAEMHIKPLPPPLLEGEIYHGTVQPGSAEIFPIDVPVDAISLTITVSQDTAGSTNLLMLVQRDLIPYYSTNFGTYDFVLKMTNGVTNTLTIDANTEPQLTPGTYFVAIANPGISAASFTISIAIQYASAGGNETIVLGGGATLRDDAKTILVRDSAPDKVIADIAVAIVSENARVSDLVLHLVSPQGTRVLLSENRGRFLGDGFGSTEETTDIFGNVFTGPSYAVFTDHPELGLPIKFAIPPFGDSSNLRGPVIGEGFDGASQGFYPAPIVVDGWKVDTNTLTVITGDAYSSPNFANLDRNGSISRVLPTVRGRSYRLSMAYRGQTQRLPTYQPGTLSAPRLGPLFSTGQTIDTNFPVFVFGSTVPMYAHTNAPLGTKDDHYVTIVNPDTAMTPVPPSSDWELFIAVTNAPPFPGWMPNDTNSQWIALSPDRDNGHPPGLYVHRTTFIVYSFDTNSLVATGRAAADDGIHDIIVNGVSKGISGGSPTNFTPLPLFELRGFTNGANTIDFVVTNKGNSQGLRTDLSLSFDAGIGVTNAMSLISTEPSIGYVKLIGQSSTTNIFSGADGWKIFEMEFVADSDDMVLQLYSGRFPSVDFDDIRLEDTGTKFYQPEEALDILIGERSMGEWRLEAWDNRTGATVPAELIDWQVLMATVNSPRRAEALAKLSPYPVRINNPVISAATASYSPGSLRFSEVEWFYFDVCPGATRMAISVFTPATNTSPVELLMDRSGFPTALAERDDYASAFTAFGRAATLLVTLSTTNPAAAPLIPGKRMFFGVRNANRFANNRFAISINSDGACAFVTPTAFPVNTRLDDVAFASDSVSDFSARFRINTPGASTVNVTVEDEAHLTILASTGVEPTLESYQVRLEVTSPTATLALPSGGAWNIKVINNSDFAAPYSLTSVSGAGVTIRTVEIVGGKLRVTWTSKAGDSYEIATSTDLVNWNAQTTVTATGAETTYTDATNATGSAKFYRIRPLE